MSDHPRGDQLRFAFFTETFMYRSEVFFYRQATGLRDAHVTVLARQGALLDEFPVDDLFLVDEFRNPRDRLKLAIERRLDRSTQSSSRMRNYAIRRLARHLNRQPVDLLYTLFGWHAARLLDVQDSLKNPVPLVFLAPGNDVVSPHNYGEDYVRRLPEVFERSALILALSEFLQGKLLDLGAPPEKIRLHNIGIDIPPAPDERARSDGSDITILAVSRMHPMKGVPHTLRAFAQVLDSLPTARLEIIGDGNEKDSYERLATELEIDHRATFHGSRSISDVYRAMSAADIFVQHSVRTSRGEEEGLGLSIFEAAAHGLPVISTRSGGIPEGTIHGETGILVEPGDEAGMAQAIIALAGEPERRKRMGAAGREHMIRNFDVRKQNAKLEAILTGVALSHRGCNG